MNNNALKLWDIINNYADKNNGEIKRVQDRFYYDIYDGNIFFTVKDDQIQVSIKQIVVYDEYEDGKWIDKEYKGVGSMVRFYVDDKRSFLELMNFITQCPWSHRFERTEPEQRQRTEEYSRIRETNPAQQEIDNAAIELEKLKKEGGLIYPNDRTFTVSEGNTPWTIWPVTSGTNTTTFTWSIPSQIEFDFTQEMPISPDEQSQELPDSRFDPEDHKDDNES